MAEYDFTLKFRLPSSAQDIDQLIESLAEAGCDDATIGIGIPGRIALDFTREAGSAKEAIFSAVRDVIQAIPGASLIEASPDMVGISGVAEAVKCSRQYVRKVSNIGDFPSPIFVDSLAIYHLATVLAWWRHHKNTRIPEDLFEVATTNMHINTANSYCQVAPPIEFLSLLPRASQAKQL